MTQTSSARRKRPGLVTVAVVLMYIGGIAQIALGILAIFLRYTPEASEGGEALAVTLLGVAMILFGLFVVSLASGVARASRMSRLVASILLVLAVLLAVLDLVVAGDGDWSGLAVQLVVSAAVIVPLWVGPGRRYFAASTVA
ncbi:hypothetical protein SCB71_08890 [Herbiconiux sp. KACC 21604]|uniref:hypothetical protein n=1 Tax=unclassified Herbiconiux TaxID=2618217 RepID=UPI0020A4F6CA|nr:hypothetical protein [Herbiconiux sp. SALV-R1]WPO88337.1 hypothetical protein SCB71_08890 [Herbiconiux sp. KACC 21604]